MMVVFLNVLFLVLGGLYLFFRDNYSSLIMRFYLGFLLLEEKLYEFEGAFSLQ